MNNYTYVIADISELNNVDYSQVQQTSAHTVRKNIAGTKFILKYDSNIAPTTIQNLDNNGKLFEYSGTKYFNHNQIRTIISDIEWIGTYSIS